MAIDWGTVAVIATAVGVGVAAWELRVAAILAQSEFEDSLDQQYRSLAYQIPVNALIGQEVHAEDWPAAREAIYNYLDLSNEQIYLRTRKRIRKETWDDWCSGIHENLHRNAFRLVWNEVKSGAPGTFTYLERLETYEFTKDPALWK